MTRAHGIHEAWQPQSKQEREAVLRELNEVLASQHFCNSKRYPAFLRYIVENSLAGRPELLKERTLGIEVFDRPPTYDTNADTVVRYTAGEVRKRLLLYYSERERISGIRISLPAGSYHPEFALEHAGPLEPGSDLEPHVALVLPADSGIDGRKAASALVSPAIDGEALHPRDGPETVKPASSGRPLIPWLALAAVALFTLAAAVFWRSTPAPPITQVDRFWAPALRDQHAVVICTGSVVFAKNNYSGVITADKNIDYTFVSMQSASAIAQISGMLARSGVAVQLAPAPSTPLTGLSEHSVVLVGGYNNQWTMRLLQPLRFYLSLGPEEMIRDRMQPRVEWQRDPSLPYSGADDYALVARFREPAIDGWVIVVAGVGRNGTEAAAQFVTSPHYLQLLRDRIGGDFSNRNIEAVLKVSVVDGKTGAPSLLAAYAW